MGSLAIGGLMACAEGTCARSRQRFEARAFERAPSGVLEVDPEWVAMHRDAVTLVDVREEDELREDGHPPDVAWVPLAHLEEVAADWDRARPVALLCRSGRRSARGAALLEALGFERVASVTGGMREWMHAGLPVSHGSDVRALYARPRGTSPISGATSVGAHGEGASEGRAAMEDATAGVLGGVRVQWVRVASLLFGGVASCIDGRETHPIIGTPGGDAGELLLLLTAAEDAGAPPFSEEEVAHLFEAYVDAFGRFYVHSDTRAIERLGDALRADPRFAAHRARLGDARAIEAFVRHPPHVLEAPLLDYLVMPAHVGCGHLRLQLEHPAEYHERQGLAAFVLRTTFRALWRTPERVDFVVLGGEHTESGVLVVHVEGEVHPWSWVPAVAPRNAARVGAPPGTAATSAFVVHPEVTDYLRRENAALLLAETPWLEARGQRAATLDRAHLDEALARLGALQWEATVARLGAGLPRHDVVPRRR
jgi:rhodanese-related sulfurtransferase